MTWDYLCLAMPGLTFQTNRISISRLPRMISELNVSRFIFHDMIFRVAKYTSMDCLPATIRWVLMDPAGGRGSAGCPMPIPEVLVAKSAGFFYGGTTFCRGRPSSRSAHKWLRGKCETRRSKARDRIPICRPWMNTRRYSKLYTCGVIDDENMDPDLGTLDR